MSEKRSPNEAIKVSKKELFERRLEELLAEVSAMREVTDETEEGILSALGEYMYYGIEAEHPGALAQLAEKDSNQKIELPIPKIVRMAKEKMQDIDGGDEWVDDHIDGILAALAAKLKQ